jgi:hypothetical protein
MICEKIKSTKCDATGLKKDIEKKKGTGNRYSLFPLEDISTT